MCCAVIKGLTILIFFKFKITAPFEVAVVSSGGGSEGLPGPDNTASPHSDYVLTYAPDEEEI